MNIVAPWPRELTAPAAGSYLPRYYEVSDAKPGVKFHIDIHRIRLGASVEHFRGDGQSLPRPCQGQWPEVSIKNHTHTLLHDASSMLRLFDAVGDPGLGLNLDAGWAALQREYPPVAIHKTGKP